MAVNEESDLASYLLFDGAFARKLIDLGRADAEAMRDKLLAFFVD
jgi:NTE family protein